MGLIQSAHTQELDSLLTDRQNKLQDYTQFKNNMKERTWINLIDLNEKAGIVINADNELIWYHLDREMARNRAMATKNDKLMLEMAFLNKELENREEQFKEHMYLNNVFLLIILGLSIAFIISLVILIAQFRRNKHAIYELERLWSMNDDQTTSLRDKERELKKQVQLLEVENKTMRQELSFLSDQTSTARKKLEKEIQSRQKAEQEIRELTGQNGKK
jgi:UDP-2,3-diacylglucosamine pyrophosphatase LpxH